MGREQRLGDAWIKDLRQHQWEAKNLGPLSISVLPSVQLAPCLQANATPQPKDA